MNNTAGTRFPGFAKEFQDITAVDTAQVQIFDLGGFLYSIQFKGSACGKILLLILTQIHYLAFKGE